MFISIHLDYLIMAGGEAASKAEELRRRVARVQDGPVDKGTYRAQERGDSVMSCLPRSFVDRFGIEQSTELRVKEDLELGCVLIFPEEVVEDGE